MQIIDEAVEHVSSPRMKLVLLKAARIGLCCDPEQLAVHQRLFHKAWHSMPKDCSAKRREA